MYKILVYSGVLVYSFLNFLSHFQSHTSTKSKLLAPFKLQTDDPSRRIIRLIDHPS